MPRSPKASTLDLRIALATRYAAPPTAISEAALCLRIASIAAAPRSPLPIMATRPVFPSIISVNLSMRGVAAGEHFPGEEQRFARLPSRHFRARERVEADAPGLR